MDWSVNVRQNFAPVLRGMVLGDEGFESVPVEKKDGDGSPEDEELESDTNTEEVASTDSEAEAGSEEKAESKRNRIYDVVVSRKGTLRLPVKIDVQFFDGKETRTTRSFEWTREAQEASTWWRLPLEPGSEEIERVLIDPQRRYYLDGNMADNQWYKEKDLIAPLRWSERAFTQYTQLLHWYSSLGG